jgi:hypothetical protein
MRVGECGREKTDVQGIKVQSGGGHGMRQRIEIIRKEEPKGVRGIWIRGRKQAQVIGAWLLTAPPFPFWT